jgi:hypothetical protein
MHGVAPLVGVVAQRSQMKILLHAFSGPVDSSRTLVENSYENTYHIARTIGMFHRVEVGSVHLCDEEGSS